MRAIISRSELCKHTQKDECSSDVACPVDILLVPVRYGSASVHGIPTALKTAPQHAMESFLDAWFSPKSE